MRWLVHPTFILAFELLLRSTIGQMAVLHLANTGAWQRNMLLMGEVLPVHKVRAHAEICRPSVQTSSCWFIGLNSLLHHNTNLMLRLQGSVPAHSSFPVPYTTHRAAYEPGIPNAVSRQVLDMTAVRV